MVRIIYTLVLGILMVSCTNSSYERTVVSVLNDRTETDFALQPNADVIIPFFKLEGDMWQEGKFRYGNLTDLEHTSKYEVFLEGEVALFGNEFNRRSKVKQFTQEVTTILDQDTDSLGYDHSTIWEPIVKELHLLQQDTLEHTRLYIFSDLRENADWFSTYRYSDMQLLKKNPEEVQLLYLEKAQQIIPSQHINVIVVYQPQTLEEDQFFKDMSSLYREIFHQLGISISFVANLKNTSYGT